jgi:RNA polymerase sigma-70 factor, ECF subfamily
MQENHFNQDEGGAESVEFNSVVERYYQSLYRFALSLTRSEADARDLTQHSFYMLSTKGGQLRDATKVGSWLFTTLHRAFLRNRRKETRYPHYELECVGSELPTSAPEQASHLNLEDALSLLASIDDVFRAPLELFYLEDHCYKEIALVLNVPLGTVKSRIARGIAQLQKLMAAAEPPAQGMMAWSADA